jgi:hypothetical protein
MSLRKMLLPAALIAVIALFVPRANAQTMGEYAATTSNAAGSGFALPSFGPNGGGSTGTWGVSRLGASFEERAAAVSGSGMGADFQSRAAALTSGHTNESRWPGTGFSSTSSENRFGSSENRFSTGDRFATNDARFSSSENRFPESKFKDHMGLDTRCNAINPY